MTEQVIRQTVARALSGLKLMLGRGRTILINENADKGGTQFIQTTVSAKEIMDLPRLAEFGFVSRPPKDSDCVIVFLTAERTWGVIIATGNQKARFKLANDGEMAIHDANGADGAAGKWVWAKKKTDDDPGGWEIEANGEPMVINNAKKITINAGTDGVILNTTGDVTLNMGGKNLTVSNAGTVVLGPGGKKVVVDGDPVIGGGGGHVQASQSVVKA